MTTKLRTICRRCEGDGCLWADDPNDAQPCPACEGTGIPRSDWCPKCHGWGEVNETVERDPQEWMPCPRCEGDGRRSG